MERQASNGWACSGLEWQLGRDSEANGEIGFGLAAMVRIGGFRTGAAWQLRLGK